MRRDVALLLALAAMVNAGAARFVRAPAYLDDSYYFSGALRLAGGYGFTEPYLWNYLGNPSSLPQPSHLYWMPLTSIVSAASMAIFGQSFGVARAPLLIIASLLPAFAYQTSLGLGGTRRHALGAALLTIFCGFYFPYWGTTDSFALFAAVSWVALWSMHRARQTGSVFWQAAAGIAAGLAHLTRADGILLMVVAVLSFAIGRHRQAMLVAAAGYGLVMLPWFVRNALTVGSPLGAGGAGTLWLINYDDLFNHPPDLTAARYFSAGWQVIALGKWQALTTNLQTIIGVQGMVFLAPFIAVGLWHLRPHFLARATCGYAALLYAVMTLAFSFPGARGGLFHSGAALLPFYMAAAVIGIDVSVLLASRRLRHWHVLTAARNFTLLAIMLSAVMTLAISIPKLIGWNAPYEQLAIVATALPREAVVMSNNPPALYAAGGFSGVIVPNGDTQALMRAAETFGVSHVLLDKNHPQPLAALYHGVAPEELQLVWRHADWRLFEVSSK